MSFDFWNPVAPPATPPLQTANDVTLETATPPPQNLPYLALPGDTNVASPVIQAGANLLFPIATGINGPGTTVLRDFNQYPGTGVPAEFNNAPTTLSTTTPESFPSWATAYQVEYLMNHTSPVPLVVGSGSTAIHVILGADPAKPKVYILENLQKQDFATMPTADQVLIANTPYFQSTLSVLMNLIPNSAAPSPAIDPSVNSSSIASPVQIANMTADITVNHPTGTVDVSSVSKAKNYILDAIVGAEATIANSTRDTVTSSTRFTTAAGQIFINELDNLKTRAEAQSVFSVQDIQDQIAAITTRFNQLQAFGTVVPPTQATTIEPVDNGSGTVNFTEDAPDQWRNVISDDDLATINSGYDKMLAAETRILAIDNKNMQISSAGVLTNGVTDKHLDAPALIFMFQLNANQTLEQTNSVATEMVNQQNALLRTYGIMQQIVHETQGKFGTDSTQKLGIFGVDNTKDPSDLIANLPATAQQFKILSMFEDALGDTTGKTTTPAAQLSPVEKLLKLTIRPTWDMYNNPATQPTNTDPSGEKVNGYTSTEWGEFGTMLSDAVTQINQNNQIQMNDINSTQKQQDRHFDLANNALSKAADIIQSIGRNLN